MKKFSNINKIQDAVADLFQSLDLDMEDTNQNVILTANEKNTYTGENDGALLITEGKLDIIPPKIGGNWPILKPSENVCILLNGKEVKEPILIRNVDDIEIKLKNKEPKSNFYLHMSDDCTKITLETEFISGETFRIKDTRAQHELEIEVLTDEVIEPLPIKEELVYEKIKELGVILDIDRDVISKACNSLTNKQVVVVQGKEMIPPVDGYIEYMFDDQERIYKDKDDDGHIDYFDKGDINSVVVGRVLAKVVPPIPGEPGLTVTGKTIFPPKEKHAKLHVGSGAKLINNGQVAVATLNGRPVVKGSRKTISVIPELVINSDVNLETGHINFKGDVKIFGNVTEGFIVKATGKVNVLGSVFHGKVYGENGVYIDKNLIGGVVFAGGEAAEYKSMLPLFTSLQHDLHGIEKAFNQVIKNKSFSTRDIEIRGHGTLIKLIIETRFPNIPKILKVLYKRMAKDKGNQGIWPVIGLLHTRLTGLGPVNIKSIDEIVKYKEFMGKIIEYVEEDMDVPANVHVNYCQNATIKASGSVVIGSAGVYHSNIHCGKEIYANGFCRGGELCAGTKVVVKEVGSVMNIPTLVAVSQGGEIVAGLMHVNVTLKIGGYVRKNINLKKRVKITFKDKWIEDII